MLHPLHSFWPRRVFFRALRARLLLPPAFPALGPLLAAGLAACSLVLGAAFPAQAASFLWRVERGGQTAYLVGSMHFADQGMYPLAPAFDQAFENSDVLAVEADVSVNPQALARLLLDLASYPPGMSLSQELSDEAKAAFQREGLDWTRYDRFRPWYALMAMQSQRLVQLGFRPELGIDVHFLELAHARGMPVRELEGVEWQCRMFAELEDLNKDAYLRFSLLEMNSMEKFAPRMAEVWRQGDAPGMTQMLFGSPLFNAVFKPLNEKLYFQRNTAMAEKISGYLDSGEVHFVIVGAGHLVGSQGLLELLRKQGCALQQL